MLLVLGRPLGTTKEAGFGVSQGRPVSTTVEGRSIWYETCGYHSRLEGCLSGGSLCKLLTDSVQKYIVLAKNNVLSVLVPID